MSEKKIESIEWQVDWWIRGFTTYWSNGESLVQGGDGDPERVDFEKDENLIEVQVWVREEPENDRFLLGEMKFITDNGRQIHIKGRADDLKQVIYTAPEGESIVAINRTDGWCNALDGIDCAPCGLGRIEKMFQDADMNVSGFIEKYELQNVAAAFGHILTDEQLDKMMEVLDSDKDGRVSLGEFKSWYLKADSDHDGYISSNEFKSFLRKYHVNAGPEPKITKMSFSCGEDWISSFTIFWSNGDENTQGYTDPDKSETMQVVEFEDDEYLTKAQTFASDGRLGWLALYTDKGNRTIVNQDHDNKLLQTELYEAPAGNMIVDLQRDSDRGNLVSGEDGFQYYPYDDPKEDNWVSIAPNLPRHSHILIILPEQLNEPFEIKKIVQPSRVFVDTTLWSQPPETEIWSNDINDDENANYLNFTHNGTDFMDFNGEGEEGTPIRMKPRAEIPEEHFWIKTPSVKYGDQVAMNRVDTGGRVCADMWGEEGGAILVFWESTSVQHWNLNVRKVGADSIKILSANEDEEHPFFVVGENNVLRACATEDDATVFKVLNKYSMEQILKQEMDQQLVPEITTSMEIYQGQNEEHPFMEFDDNDPATWQKNIRPQLEEPLSQCPSYEKVKAPLTESMLDTTFRIIRKEVIDNFVMEDQTIALSVEGHGFLDTSSRPMRVRQREYINEETDLWLRVHFKTGWQRKWFRTHEGKIGLRTYPERKQLCPQEGFLIRGESTDRNRNLEYKRCGNHGIVISSAGQYYRIASNGVLCAVATLEEATVFNVHRFSERLSSKMRGVNVTGWFYNEFHYSTQFYEYAPGIGKEKSDELCEKWGFEEHECAKIMGEEAYREYWNNWLETFVTEDDFKKMRKLGINSIRLPMYQDAMPPQNGNYETYYDYDTNFMNRCWRDMYTHLDRAYDWADKYGIGIYVSNFARKYANEGDVRMYLAGIEEVCKRYSHRHSFIGFDLANEAHGIDDHIEWYQTDAYKLIRSYSPNCLIHVSEMFTWWLRLAPDVTGIVIDSHQYSSDEACKLRGMEYAECKVKRQSRQTMKTMKNSPFYIAVTGETSVYLSSQDYKIAMQYYPGDQIEPYKNLLRCFVRLWMDEGDGALYYAWKCYFDRWMKFHMHSYMLASDFGFNEIFMQTETDFKIQPAKTPDASDEDS